MRSPSQCNCPILGVNSIGRIHLTAIEQLWIVDITYIRLKAQFVYLALVLNGFSRKAVELEAGSHLA